MGKRFLALFMTLVLAFSCILLTSCDKDKDNGNVTSNQTDVSAPPKPELTAKEHFENCSNEFIKRFTAGKDIKEVLEQLKGSEKKPFEATTEVLIDSLAFQDKAIVNTDTIGNPMKITGTSAFDGESTSANANINFFDEDIKFSAVLADDKVIFSLPGVTEKPVTVESAGDDGQIDVSKLPETLKKLPEIAQKISDFFKTHIKDTMFSKEVKTVTVNGKNFENATVVTLSITEEEFAKIFEDFKTFIKSDEDIKALLSAIPDFPSEEFGDKLDEMFSIKCSLKASYTAKDDKVIAFESLFTGKEDTKAEAKTDESSADDEKPTTDTISIGMTDVDGNLDLTLSGKSDEEEVLKGHVKITKTGTKDNFDCGLTIFDEDEEVINIALSSVCENKKFDGTLKVGFAGNISVGLNFTFAMFEKGYEFGISDLSLKSEDMNIEIPAEISIRQKYTDKEIISSGKFKLKVPNTLDISLEFKSTVKTSKPAKVEIPSDTVPSDDLDPDDIMTKLSAKYPDTMKFLEAVMSEPEDL